MVIDVEGTFESICALCTCPALLNYEVPDDSPKLNHCTLTNGSTLSQFASHFRRAVAGRGSFQSPFKLRSPLYELILYMKTNFPNISVLENLGALLADLLLVVQGGAGEWH